MPEGFFYAMQLGNVTVAALLQEAKPKAVFPFLAVLRQVFLGVKNWTIS